MTDLFTQNKTRKLKKDSYNSDDIIVLEGLEPVRKRPGMYIGGTDEKAYHHLIIEVLDNCIDEAIEGHANLIEIELLSLNTVKISDNGRGIPIDNHPKYPNKSALEVILTTLHSGGKFNDKNYLTFNTRRNRKIDLTEYYNLIYEYKNDCLIAGIKYDKSYYEDRDLKPSENLLFSITLTPLTSFEQKIDQW